ncbi:MAG: 50S ribosomal protein L6 [Planctomycetota bacterium]
MSRIGKQPIPVPSAVKVSISGRTVNVEGPKGKLSWTHRPEISVRMDESDKQIVVERHGENRLARSLHGLTRKLIANMVTGTLEGFSKSLELYGVGFGVQVQGNKFTMNCGYSHPVVLEIPPGLSVEIKTPQARGDSEPARFSVHGADKQAVGELAARIYKARPPEPYKGKGVRYAGEHIRRKVGKAFVGTGG